MGRVALGCVLAGASLLLVLLVADRLADQRLPPCAGTADEATSFLAVGDFGKPPLVPEALDPRASVARALDEVHRCAPVAGLLMLGDNFYPGGLGEENFEARVRDTLVGLALHRQ